MGSSRSVRFLLCSLAASLSLISLAGIAYKVKPTQDMKRLDVTVEFDTKGSNEILQMPSWSPGLYVLENYWQGMDDVKAFDEQGKELSLDHKRGDTWVVDTAGHKKIRVTYSKPVQRGFDRIGMFSSDDTTIHYGGPTVYLYVVGRKSEKCNLNLDTPKDWKIAVSLGPAKGSDGHTFVANGYDELADCSVTMGDFRVEKYTVRGKEHMVTLRGPAKDTIDAKKAARICEFVTKSHTDFFGGAPYHRYIWHFFVNESRDGSGGVEHSSCTQMFLANGLGPGALGGISHEYFHLWNVKRVRSKELGPFDYTQLPRSGALWWLEGVTDYFSSLLPYRNGAWNREAFFEDALGNIQSVRGNPARLDVSPWDSGYKTPDAATSFSSGYRVNYYPTGWVLGMMFDIELRSRTGGKHSLDDVEKALWFLCKDDKPGFEQDEIRKQLIRFGGASMGELYDAWVMKPGELPVEAQLAKMGLEISGRSFKEKADITSAQKKLLEGWLRSKPLVKLL